jgi:hypothetical protein
MSFFSFTKVENKRADRSCWEVVGTSEMGEVVGKRVGG